MESREVNPYQSSEVAAEARSTTTGRGAVFLAIIACIYYGMSICTLPFARALWFGEVPLLALVQIPKAFLKSAVHEGMLFVVHALGMSFGSGSKDYFALHFAAMVIMLVVPALLLVGLLAFFARGRLRARSMIWLIMFAVLDACVTLGFDATSNLKLFNGSYF